MATLANDCSIMLQLLMSNSGSEQFSCVDHVVIPREILTLCLIGVRQCILVLSTVLLLINEGLQYGNAYTFNSMFIIVIISCNWNMTDNIPFASGKLHGVSGSR